MGRKPTPATSAVISTGESLGEKLELPPWLEPMRVAIGAVLCILGVAVIMYWPRTA